MIKQNKIRTTYCIVLVLASAGVTAAVADEPVVSAPPAVAALEETSPAPVVPPPTARIAAPSDAELAAEAAALQGGTALLDDGDDSPQSETVALNEDIPSGSSTTRTESRTTRSSQASSGDVVTQSTPGSAGLWANYFGILYGPALKDPSAYQPTGTGAKDLTRPVVIQNYATLGYQLNDSWAISASGYWLWYPTQGQNMVMQDPFVRLSDASILSNDDGMFLYGDVRWHFGVTNESREADLITGLQAFQVFSYPVSTTRLSLGARASEWLNVYGKHGSGDQVQLYFAPTANYQLSPSLAFTCWYEMGANRLYGASAFNYYNNGTDLEPGVEWDPTPNLMINPYLTLTTGEKVTWKSTSIGMLLSWSIL